MFLWIATVVVAFGVLAVVTMFVTWIATSTARTLETHRVRLGSNR